MRKYEDLTETEKMLRSLIYAAEGLNKRDTWPEKTPEENELLSRAYLNHKLQEAKELAAKLEIELVE